MSLITVKFLPDAISARFQLPGDSVELSRQLRDQGAYAQVGTFTSPSNGEAAADMVWRIITDPDLVDYRFQLLGGARDMRAGDIVEVDNTVWLRNASGWYWYSV